jgi:solute:Na+ symporter, SSS family
VGFLLLTFQWADISAGLQTASVDQSKINPYQTSDIENYTLAFFLITAFKTIFIQPVTGSGPSTYALGKSSHETRMAGILSELRDFLVWKPLLIIGIFGFAIMNLPLQQELLHTVDTQLAGLPLQERNNLKVPMFLAALLPAGLIGAFASIMLSAFVSTTSTYYLNYGGSFIQDVVLPFKQKS